MIFLCYMTSIINATNTHGSEPRIDKNTGDNDDNINSGSKAVPAGLTQNSSNKLQDTDHNGTEDRLEGAKHNLLQKDKTRKHDKVGVKDIRYNKKLADADNTGSETRPAELDNGSKDENKAKETTAIDGKTPANDTDDLHTQQMHEEDIKHNQSLYKRWLKQRYDQYLSLGGKKKTDITVALRRYLTWDDYQNLMLYLKYDIDSFIGHNRKSPKYLAEWYKQGIYEDDTTYVDGDEPFVDSNLILTGNFTTTTENKPTERKTMEENKNDRQVKAKRSVSNNPNTHKQIVPPVEIDKKANFKDKKTSNPNKPEAKNIQSSDKLTDVSNEKAVVGDAIAAEKVGNEAKPNTENKNKILQQNLDTKVTNKSDTENQENNSNTQKEVKADEQKKQKNNLENLQNDANKLKPGTAEHKEKNKAGTKENETEDMCIYKPIKHYSAAKSKQTVTMSTIPNEDNKNMSDAKSNTANMKQPETMNATTKKDDKNMDDTNVKQPEITATAPKKDDKNTNDTNAKQPDTTATTSKKGDKNTNDTNAKQPVTTATTSKKDDLNTDDANAKQPVTTNTAPKKDDMNTDDTNAKQQAEVSATYKKDDKKSDDAKGNAAYAKQPVTASKKLMKDDKHKNIANRNAANRKPAAQQVTDESFLQRNKKLITILMAVAIGMMLGGLCLYFLHQLKK